MRPVCLDAVGVLGAGLPDWSSTRAILRGERAYEPAPPPQPEAAMLPANERRRAALSVRWALAAAHQAVRAGGCEPGEVATVFATSGADGETLHRICETLATPARDLSPTRFHNSVHNAAAGYWTIAARSQRPSVSLCGYDGSFAAGLLEAASQVEAEGEAVLLVAYDVPYPAPLHAARPFGQPFAVAMLFSPQPRSATLARLSVAAAADEGARTPFPPALAREFESNPAGCSLVLLDAVARARSEPVRLAYLDGCQLVVTPA